MSKILIAREKRSLHIKELMEEYKYKTILVLKTNVPGINKNPANMMFICNLFNILIHDIFGEKIIIEEQVESLDGNYKYYAINEEGNIVKEKTIVLEEENPLGRLVDMDVYNKTAISRKDVSCDMRKCLICDNYSHICVRNQTHSEKEVFNKINEIIEKYLKEYILTKVMKCIYFELELYPKFGLVSNRNNGCHKDMNYETFVQSTFAIKPYLKEYINYGLKDLDDPLMLQEIGKRAEKAMFETTNNINTQKGLIFILGIFLPVISNAIYHNLDVSYIKEEIKRIAAIIVGDYYDDISIKEYKTHGDNIYIDYGLKGIRGEALEGLQKVFEIPSYNGSSIEDTHLEYLIHIMSVLDDTTIIHRTNLETLNSVQKDMKYIVNSGGYSANIELVEKLSNDYIKKNISPGGSSDMLVVKIIFEELKFLLKN